jgi:hypothetical protein
MYQPYLIPNPNSEYFQCYLLAKSFGHTLDSFRADWNNLQSMTPDYRKIHNECEQCGK